MLLGNDKVIQMRMDKVVPATPENAPKSIYTLYIFMISWKTKPTNNIIIHNNKNTNMYPFYFNILKDVSFSFKLKRWIKKKFKFFIFFRYYWLFGTKICQLTRHFTVCLQFFYSHSEKMKFLNRNGAERRFFCFINKYSLRLFRFLVIYHASFLQNVEVIINFFNFRNFILYFCVHPHLRWAFNTYNIV